MRYIGRMVTKLLLNNGFIDSEDKAEIQDEFERNFEELKENKHPIVRMMFTFFNSPIGIFLTLFGWVKLSRLVRIENMLEQQDTLENTFKEEYKAQIFKELLTKQKLGE